MDCTEENEFLLDTRDPYMEEMLSDSNDEQNILEMLDEDDPEKDLNFDHHN